jgi:GT2 family glycosyltransferase
MIETKPPRVSARTAASTDALSIASVTVAYNGEHELGRHLEGLRHQNRKLDEIIVVDNASTDDTHELLERGYPDLTVLHLPENRGVGGGLAAGLAYALEKEHDWVWTFDQDSIPNRDCLEQLLNALSFLDGESHKAAVLAPVCVHLETGMMCHGLSWRGSRLLPTAIVPNQPITLLDSVISSGSLIRREALEKAGLPRTDFFMDFVDHEHCLRLRRSGFNIAMVRDSHLQHALGEPAKFKFLGRSKYWSDHAPWREYYMTRNEIFTMWKYYPQLTVKVLVLYRLARHALDILLFGKNKTACLAMMYRGFVDGRAGRLGIQSFNGQSG